MKPKTRFQRFLMFVAVAIPVQPLAAQVLPVFAVDLQDSDGVRTGWPTSNKDVFGTVTVYTEGPVEAVHGDPPFYVILGHSILGVEPDEAWLNSKIGDYNFDPEAIPGIERLRNSPHFVPDQFDGTNVHFNNLIFLRMPPWTWIDEHDSFFFKNGTGGGPDTAIYTFYAFGMYEGSGGPVMISWDKERMSSFRAAGDQLPPIQGGN